jgi:hypothetical protein
MNMNVRMVQDRSLHFLTESQAVVATLSPNAVAALYQLALVAPQNPVVDQHIQTIIRQLPTVIHETARLGITARADDGTVQITDVGHRLITWLAREWADWAVYNRHVSRSVGAVWGWHTAYPPAQVGGV